MGGLPEEDEVTMAKKKLEECTYLQQE